MGPQMKPKKLTAKRMITGCIFISWSASTSLTLGTSEGGRMRLVRQSSFLRNNVTLSPAVPENLTK